MSECCSFAPEEAKKEEYTVYTDELAKEVGVDPRPNRLSQSVQPTFC